MKIKGKQKDNESITLSGRIFKYDCLNWRGEKIKGEIRATNKSHAKQALQRQGYYPLSIRHKIALPISFFKPKIKKNEITYFCRQLTTLLAAGVSLAPACDIVAKETQNQNLANLISEIKTNLEAGLSLAETLSRYPHYFDPFLCHLVSLGETSGSIDAILKNISNYRDKIESLKKKIHKSLFYPAVVITFAIVITAMLLFFVVPQFEQLFEGMGATLPVYTQMVLRFSKGIQHSGIQILLGSLCFFWILVHFKRKYPRFHYLLDKITLTLPIISPLLRKVYVARCAHTLAITFMAGIPLIEGLHQVAGATGNEVYRQGILKIRDYISLGSSIHGAMRETGLFPHMAVQLIAIGEESGTLDKMLLKIATIFEEEVDTTVEGITSLLEPFTMIILGLLIGSLVISMYLPIFNMGQAM